MTNTTHICPICGNEFHEDMMYELASGKHICIACACLTSTSGGKMMIKNGVQDDAALTIHFGYYKTNIVGLKFGNQWRVTNPGEDADIPDFYTVSKYETTGKELKEIETAVDYNIANNFASRYAFDDCIDIAQLMAFDYVDGHDSEQEMKALMHNCWHRCAESKFKDGMAEVGEQLDAWLPEDYQNAAELIERKTFMRYPKFEVIMPLFKQIVQEPETQRLRAHLAKRKAEKNTQTEDEE